MNAGQEGTPAPLDNGSGIAALSPQSVLEPAAEAPSQPAAAPAEAPGPAAGQNRPAKPVRGPVRRFIRSVASHLVFAAIVTTAVVGYLYQREILNRVGDTLCTEDRLGGYMTKAARPSALLPSGGEQTAAPSVPVAAAPAITLSQPQPPAQSEPAPQPVLEQHASVSAPQPGAEPEPAAENVSTTAAPVTPAPVPPAPVPAGSGAASPVTATVASASPPVSPDTLVSEWQAARQAYSAHKPEAPDIYRELVAKYPDNASLRGEYGNVLYALGRSKEAAEQYYEAALQQLKGPQPELGACMEEVIARLDPALGGILREKIAQPCPYKAK
ncbi:MAG: hypothetical protein ACLPJY_03465 [Rhodomicrobium sp.]